MNSIVSRARVTQARGMQTRVSAIWVGSSATQRPTPSPRAFQTGFVSILRDGLIAETMVLTGVMFCVLTFLATSSRPHGGASHVFHNHNTRA